MGGQNLAHFLRPIHPSLPRLSFLWRKVFQFFIQEKFQLSTAIVSNKGVAYRGKILNKFGHRALFGHKKGPKA
jgi:hypothetical protein